VTPWPLWVTALVCLAGPLWTLLCVGLGYRWGRARGEALLCAYQEGQARDGGCFVKAQAETPNVRGPT